MCGGKAQGEEGGEGGQGGGALGDTGGGRSLARKGGLAVRHRQGWGLGGAERGLGTRLWGAKGDMGGWTGCGAGGAGKPAGPSRVWGWSGTSWAGCRLAVDPHAAGPWPLSHTSSACGCVMPQPTSGGRLLHPMQPRGFARRQGLVYEPPPPPPPA